MTTTRPLIVTLQLDEDSFSFFDHLRRQYFPPALNYLNAHLTLFHHLPAGEPAIPEDLRQLSKGVSSLPLSVTEVKSIGRGVAYKIESEPLVKLHREMQTKWKGWLQPQDLQKLWQHITVQNKVTPGEAQHTFKTLSASFKPFTATGTGFSLWTYEGGPWKAVKTFPFSGL